MRIDIPAEIDVDNLSDLEKLAYAVILFHGGSPWTDEDDDLWVRLVGQHSANTRTLCNFARRVIGRDQIIC